MIKGRQTQQTKQVQSRSKVGTSTTPRASFCIAWRFVMRAQPESAMGLDKKLAWEE
jgi:hypothetical protein